MAPGRQDEYDPNPEGYADEGADMQQGMYDQAESPMDDGAPQENLGSGLLPQINLPVMVALGRSFMSIQDILKLKPGQILELNKSPNEPVDLVVNGKVVARGELVDVDGRLAVRLIKITE